MKMCRPYCYRFGDMVKRRSFDIGCQVMLYLISCSGLHIPADNGASVSGFATEIPENVVLVAGNEKVFPCAGGLPFRWYRYRISNPNLDEVIFMGSQMADHVDDRFTIYRSPEIYPYKQLELRVTNIEASLGGTYRCFRQQDSHCAELIVLDSEPKCRIHREGSDNTVQFICSVNVTENGQPEMLCKHNSQSSMTDTSSCERSNGTVTCMVKVPAEMETKYSCVVKINARPVTKYRTCSHANNKPSYTYTWESSSVISLEVSNDPFRSPIFLGVLAVAGVLLIIVVIFIAQYCNRNRKGPALKRMSSTSSSESGSSESSSSASRKSETDAFLPVDEWHQRIKQHKRTISI